MKHFPSSHLAKLLIILLLTTPLIGCSAGSKQYESLKSAFANFEHASETALIEHAWVVSYQGYRATVYAINHPQGILFANQTGDAILFDGWHILSAKGLGILNSRWLIKHEKLTDEQKLSWQKTYHMWQMAEQTHRCDLWRTYQFAYKQICQSAIPYTNVIKFNTMGQAILIQQVINPGTGAVILEKLNAQRNEHE